MSTYCQVLVPRPFEEAFDYAVPTEIAAPDGNLPLGSIVRVPFGKQHMWGVVWSHNPISAPKEKIKAIEAVSPLPALSENLRDFISWMAGYSCNPLGSCVSLILPHKDALEEAEPKRDLLTPCEQQSLTLSEAQQHAAEQLLAQQEKGGFSVSVLEGVTGSGKTEIYMEAVASIIKSGKQALVMLPEIVLTNQMISRFAKRFGQAPLLWHSNLTPAMRRDSFRLIASGKAPIVLGARSALFLPFARLGGIVVDEEHEPAYKQEDNVVYHGRDMAVARAKHEEIPITLVSATPSLETVQNINEGKYTHINIKGRYGVACLPDMHVVDMRDQQLDAQHWLSGEVKTAMKETLARNQQVLLYLNRRGYAPLTLCRTCGHRYQCDFCESWLVQHQHKKSLQCHHCGYTESLPESCPECGKEDSLAACGPGVERLEAEAASLFPEAKTCVLSSDHMAGNAKSQAQIEAIIAGEIDIIIGTQMVAKGHHFPKLTCVAVIDADMGLEGGDVRAAERSFHLLAQVAGRAGRESAKGHVYLQTYAPESGLMQQLSAQDKAAFTAHELTRRKQANMPPYGRLAAVVFSGSNQRAVWEMARSWVGHLPGNIAPHLQVYGPVTAPMGLLRGKHRVRLLIHSKKDVPLSHYMQRWKAAAPASPSVHVKLDIDPYSFV